jgi:hypothetical protein
MSARFVKSANTSTPVNNSRSELERILRRYGCTGFASASDYETHKATITFRVPDSTRKDAPQVPVRLEIDVLAVAQALTGIAPDKQRRVGQRWNAPVITGYTDDELAQSERVAWRHLVLWVDAACSAAAAGMQTMTEAFFAHILVRDESGRLGRMIDYSRTLGGDTAMRRALPAGSDSGETTA